MIARGRWAGETLRPPPHWEEDTVRLWLEQAVDTLRRLPDAERKYIHGRTRAWPEIVRSAAEAYGYGDAAPRRGPPEAAAIDNLGRQRLEIWRSADGGSWSVVIVRVDGMTCLVSSGVDWEDVPLGPTPGPSGPPPDAAHDLEFDLG